VVSLNLAHPVVWILRNTLTLYAMWCSDYNQFCHHISVQINDTMFITGNMIHPTVTAVCPRHIDSVTDNRVGREPIDLLSCPHDPRDALGPVSHALVCLRLKSAARHDNACPRSHHLRTQIYARCITDSDARPRSHNFCTISGNAVFHYSAKQSTGAVQANNRIRQRYSIVTPAKSQSL